MPDFVGATGVYPIAEIITNTSNDLIANDIYNSNLLATQINSILLKGGNTIFNDTATLRTNNINTTRDTISGHDYAWDETLLEPLNHLSSVAQVQSNLIPPQLDSSLFALIIIVNDD